MSSFSEGLLQVLAGAVSGGGVGAIASVLAAKVKAWSDARRTDAGLAHAVVEAELERQRALWARVETLERRCDERDTHIDQLEESLLESQRVASECEARYARLQSELAEMRTRFDSAGGEP